jgi:maltose O-acetyltransferase
MEDVVIDHSHAWHITIGDDVTLAPRVHILAHDASTKRYLGFTRLGKVKIGDRVFVGAGAIILPGVTIGDDVIIGAGSVVSHDVPSGKVAAGNPASVLCNTHDYMGRKKEEMSKVPVFDDTYTLSQGVTESMKKEMNQSMKDRIGYVS